MYTCISFHHSRCSLNCPGCYLKKRPTNNRVLYLEEVEAILAIAKLEFEVDEFAVGINTGADSSEIDFISSLINKSLMNTRRLTTSMAPDYHMYRKYRDGSGFTRLTEIFMSIDRYRMKKSGHASVIYTFSRSWESLLSPNIHKGMAILLTTETLDYIHTLLINNTVDEYYLITPRNLPMNKHQIEEYNTKLTRVIKRVTNTHLANKITFDHCTLMGINEERCGQHGLLDIDEFGGIRTCVYDEQPDFYLSEEDPVGHFKEFMTSVQNRSLLKDYGIAGADCNNCPILHSKREKN